MAKNTSGGVRYPVTAHRRACAAAGLESLTLHGLRRSFACLCEWLDIPGGVSAQIQGHRPQGGYVSRTTFAARWICFGYITYSLKLGCSSRPVWSSKHQRSKACRL